MKRYRILIFFPIIVLLFSTCDGFKKVADDLFESSERAKYERRFAGADSVLSVWKSSYETALNNKLQIADGYAVTARSKAGASDALGYLITLKRGDQFIVEAAPVPADYKIFVDMGDSADSVQSAKSDILQNGKFSKLIDKSSVYRVVVQPEIGFNGDYQLKMYTQPALSFPVAGKGNSDVQSFWGAVRGGGSRSHEGVDIFARRGTPVVAASDGYVTRTGNSGLGGKQVWLRDTKLGHSQYYAHLDSIMVSGGVQIKAGDTLGTVGSTGNAEGGAPHLHFGIYAMGGAADPYPFIRKRPVPKTVTADFNPSAAVKAGSNIRKGPGTGFDILFTERDEMPVQVVAGTGGWFHIKTSDGREGFINAGRLQR